MVQSEGTFRGFVAVEIGEAARGFLSRFLERISENAWEYRLVAPETLHITLEFLGDKVERSLVGDISEAIHESASGFHPFRLTLGGLGSFPPQVKPRVIYVKVDGEQDILDGLARDIRKRLGYLGFKDDGRFQSHITLARRKESQRREKDRAHVDRYLLDAWQKVYDSIRWEENPDLSWLISEVFLMESRLTPGGPIYSKVAGIHLPG